MSDQLWARLQADVGLNLRRGAWYRVLKLDGLEAVLDVRRQPVRVLRALLEMSPRPPLKWAVVTHAAGAENAPDELRGGYAVCPSCRERTTLPKKRARTLRCPRCRDEFDIDWDDSYLRTY